MCLYTCTNLQLLTSFMGECVLPTKWTTIKLDVNFNGMRVNLKVQLHDQDFVQNLQHFL
jgi:hypothetical protein